jgi:hypothetical protein
MSDLDHAVLLLAAVLGGLVVCLVALERLERWLNHLEPGVNRSGDDDRSEE